MEKIRSGSKVLRFALDEKGETTLWTGTRDASLPTPVDGDPAPASSTEWIPASKAVLHCFAEVMGFRKAGNAKDCIDSGVAWFRLRAWGSATRKSDFWCHGMCTCTPEVQESETERWKLAGKAIPCKTTRVPCNVHPPGAT